jgi:hypothetical protein
MEPIVAVSIGHEIALRAPQRLNGLKEPILLVVAGTGRPLPISVRALRPVVVKTS